MPAILVDGQFVLTGAVTRPGLVQIEMLTTFPNGTVLYSLDGSEPSFSSSLYIVPFAVRRTVTVRAVAWDANFGNSWEADPVQVIIEPTYALNASTAGGGTVTSAPSSVSYLNNTMVTLVATPDPGWAFLQWLGDASGSSATTSVLMTRIKCVEAVFGTGLSTTTAGGGAVAVQPSAALYPYGTAVRLTGVPQTGNAFALWGNAVSGTNNPLNFTVTSANRTVSAAFAPLSAGQYSLALLADGFGMVTNRPRGNRFGTSTSVTLTAAPDAGQQFLGWSGDVSGTQNPLTVVMNAGKVITAQFTKRPQLTPLLCGSAANGEEIKLLLTGEFGQRYSIQAATNLALPPAATVWTPLATVTNVFGAVQFNDSVVTNGTQRFYRATVAAP
jgi:hypothetical protein